MMSTQRHSANLFLSALLLLGNRLVAATESAAIQNDIKSTGRRLMTPAPRNFVVVEGQRLEVDRPGLLENIPSNIEVDEDTISELGQFIADPSTGEFTVFVGAFRGDLEVDRRGDFRYDAELNGLGTFKFSYRLCHVVTGVCSDRGEVRITVIDDVNRPASLPIAIGTFWEVTEGDTRRVGASGFLSNDIPFSAANGNSPDLFSPDQIDSGLEGVWDGNSDGSFEYQAPECWEGREFISYDVCYEGYDDMCSQGITEIKVNRHPDRPDPAGVTSDTHTVKDGETLIVGAPGILQNDRPNRGQILMVNADSELSGFRGDLSVGEDGSFDYTPLLGELGTFRFEYEACYRDWDCVPCRTATVSITVTTNPAKPLSSSLVLEDDSYTVEQYQTLNGNVFQNDAHDSRYTLRIEDNGGLDIDSGGNIDDNGFDEVGTFTYTYQACYEEWPDVCATATVTVTVTPQIPTFQSRSSGRATGYLVQWAGRDEHDCDELEPSVTLTCGLDGEVSLLDVEGSDNDLCTRPKLSDGSPDLETLLCSAQHSGELYVECRDMQDNNSTRRQLTVEMHSEAVACGQLDSTFHAVWLNTFCNTTVDPASSVWQNRGMECSGAVTPDGEGETLCYEYALGRIAQPADVIMKSSDYEFCSYNNLNFRRLLEQSGRKLKAMGNLRGA